MTYDKRMQPFIIYAMTLELKEIQTYGGYKGANILKFSFGNEDNAYEMYNYCYVKLGKKVKKTINMNMGQYEIFIPFDIEDIYSLKR